MNEQLMGEKNNLFWQKWLEERKKGAERNKMTFE